MISCLGLATDGSCGGLKARWGNLLAASWCPLARLRRFLSTNRNHGWLRDIQNTGLDVLEMLFNFEFRGNAVVQQIISNHAYRCDLQRDALRHGDREVRFG